MFLSDLSRHLSDFGRREEALRMIKEAVSIQRPLTTDQPATGSSTFHTADLASSLANLSNCLFGPWAMQGSVPISM